MLRMLSRLEKKKIDAEGSLSAPVIPYLIAQGIVVLPSKSDASVASLVKDSPFFS